MILFQFFFSSRRRHTRWPRDWSSDVCSSDLQHALAPGRPATPPEEITRHLGAPTTDTRVRYRSGSRDGPATSLTPLPRDRKSTRLNSSHVAISYAVFCLKKKKYKILLSIQQQNHQ